MAEGVITDSVYVDSKVDPGELGVNLRFRGNQVLHPKARAAQDRLISDIMRAADGQLVDLGKWSSVHLTLVFRNNRFDIDGPIKRILDALQKAMQQEIGYDPKWNDNRVSYLHVLKAFSAEQPGIILLAKKAGS